ncbi:unnamed protein product [Protopolystoma xenopodis]|uniref:Uncharacterized protein n=1 Tax=Protopolystoma xenopodis TaxID=117903 RepID=A0A3S5AWB8_9PLAT|nr:unnamed protein product [Protopolystoma xenopodis]
MVKTGIGFLPRRLVTYPCSISSDSKPSSHLASPWHQQQQLLSSTSSLLPQVSSGGIGDTALTSSFFSSPVPHLASDFLPSPVSGTISYSTASISSVAASTIHMPSLSKASNSGHMLTGSTLTTNASVAPISTITDNCSCNINLPLLAGSGHGMVARSVLQSSTGVLSNYTVPKQVQLHQAHNLHQQYQQQHTVSLTFPEPLDLEARLIFPTSLASLDVTDSLISSSDTATLLTTSHLATQGMEIASTFVNGVTAMHAAMPCSEGIFHSVPSAFSANPTSVSTSTAIAYNADITSSYSGTSDQFHLPLDTRTSSYIGSRIHLLSPTSPTEAFSGDSIAIASPEPKYPQVHISHPQQSALFSPAQQHTPQPKLHQHQQLPHSGFLLLGRQLVSGSTNLLSSNKSSMEHTATSTAAATELLSTVGVPGIGHDIRLVHSPSGRFQQVQTPGIFFGPSLDNSPQIGMLSVNHRHFGIPVVSLPANNVASTGLFLSTADTNAAVNVSVSGIETGARRLLLADELLGTDVTSNQLLGLNELEMAGLLGPPFNLSVSSSQ